MAPITDHESHRADGTPEVPAGGEELQAASLAGLSQSGFDFFNGADIGRLATAYDAGSRRYQMIDANGTITDTVYDSLDALSPSGWAPMTPSVVQQARPPTLLAPVPVPAIRRG